MPIRETVSAFSIPHKSRTCKTMPPISPGLSRIGKDRSALAQPAAGERCPPCRTAPHPRKSLLLPAADPKPQTARFYKPLLFAIEAFPVSGSARTAATFPHSGCRKASVPFQRTPRAGIVLPCREPPSALESPAARRKPCAAGGSCPAAHRLLCRFPQPDRRLTAFHAPQTASRFAPCRTGGTVPSPAVQPEGAHRAPLARTAFSFPCHFRDISRKELTRQAEHAIISERKFFDPALRSSG